MTEVENLAGKCRIMVAAQDSVRYYLIIPYSSFIAVGAPPL